MCDKQRLRPACAYAQSDQSPSKSFEYSMNVQLLAEQHLEFLSLKGGCTGWPESSLSKCHIVANHMTRLNYDIWAAHKNLCYLSHCRATKALESMHKCAYSP